MNGKLFVITGARGVGKTTLAATFAPPSEVGQVYYHDSENSANNIVSQMEAAKLGFGRYVNLLDRFTDLPGDSDLLSRISKGKLPWVTPEQRRSLAEYYTWILADLDKNLTPGKFKVYVHDTLEKFEAGMAAWVELNKAAAGVGRLAYGGLWTDGFNPLYSEFMSALYARGVETIILVSHLKTPWEGSQAVVGKVVPSGKRLLYQLSSLFLWLVNEPKNADGAPAALVLKERLGRLEPAGDNVWVMRQMLPKRIPMATWKRINEYLANGCDLENPTKGEVMSQDELQMISELVTDEQMRLMVLSAERELAELQRDTAPMISVREVKPEVDLGVARAMLEEGLSVEDIAEKLDKPVPLVRRWLNL